MRMESVGSVARIEVVARQRRPNSGSAQDSRTRRVCASREPSTGACLPPPDRASARLDWNQRRLVFRSGRGGSYKFFFENKATRSFRINKSLSEMLKTKPFEDARRPGLGWRRPFGSGTLEPRRIQRALRPRWDLTPVGSRSGAGWAEAQSGWLRCSSRKPLRDQGAPCRALTAPPPR